MRFSGLAAYAVAAGIVLILAQYGVPKSLGAHPFWATKVAWIGVPFGLVAGFVLRALKWRWSTRLLTCLVLITIAGTAAHQGRLRFAASYAEDQLAGQFWFFGWIAVAACSAALIVSLLTPRQITRT